MHKYLTQEREFIEKLIPQLSDTEAQFESKLKSLRRYLGDAVRNYGGDVEALMRAGDADDSLDYLTTRKRFRGHVRIRRTTID